MDKGCNLTFEMNMGKMKGIVWSSAFNGNRENPIWTLDLFDGIVIAFSLGYTNQSISVINQEFLFDQDSNQWTSNSSQSNKAFICV